MSANPNHGGLWTDQIWANIDASVKSTAMAIRVAQKVFGATQLQGVTSVPADRFDPRSMSITEGETKPYVEISVEFPLTNGQVNGDDTGQTALTLATLASKSLALAEDKIFLQGKDALQAGGGVKIESGSASVKKGLVDIVLDTNSLKVARPVIDQPLNSGSTILHAVAKGIGLLTKDLQAPEFGLILDTVSYAATFGSVVGAAPTSTVLSQMITGGIYPTGAMPLNTALLVALGGNPTTIYFSDDPMTELTFRDKDGKFYFRVFERVQIVARDPRSFIKLDFSDFAEPPARAP